MNAFERLADKLRDHGSTVTETGTDKAVAQCPAHNDTRPSLSISPRAADSPGVMFHCHAGCDYTAVLDELGLSVRDLFDDPRMQSVFNGQQTYVYPDGRKVHRKPGKAFSQGGNTKGRSLYRADQIGSAQTVYVAEGEKDVQAIEAVGGTAVCSAMGAGKAHLFDWTPLTGKQVIIVADNDEPGLKHAHQVTELLKPIAASVCTVKAAVGKDAADHIAAGRTLAEFVPVSNGAGPGTSGSSTAGTGQADPFEAAVTSRAAKLRIEYEARRRVENAQRPPVNYPPVRPLKDLLAQHFPPQAYRIDQVAPAGGRVLLAAQFKAGKTTLVGNLARSLADGTPFLGKFDVVAPAKAVVVIDTEMSERQTQQWLTDQRIANPANVADVITLRGNVGAFNLLEERCLAQWAARLAGLGCDYLILDCLRPVLDVLGLDENHDAGRFLAAFDTLLRRATIPDAFLVQHMGHTGERARGDSRFKDWPDATWRLVREDEEPASPRYLSAYGRDVDVPEGRLSFDPVTRHLAYAAGSRTDVKVEAALVAVIELLADSAKAGEDGMSTRAIVDALYGNHPRDCVRDALKQALRAAIPQIGVKPGPKRANLHHILHPCGTCGMPVTGGSSQHQTCAGNTS